MNEPGNAADTDTGTDAPECSRGPVRVVMTGAGGFIGSHLLARLLGAGMDVTLVGPHTGRSRYTASCVEQGIVRFFRCDGSFNDDDLLPRILGSADVLVLLGHVMPTSPTEARQLLEELSSNLVPTVRLVRAALRAKPHVVYASSVSVYGTPARCPVREDDRPSPSTPYAITKLACEEAISLLCTAAGASATILRYSAVYGPGETTSRSIPRLIRAALSGTQPLVSGDGQDELDYIHVGDVVDATMEALRRRVTGVFNVGTGTGTTAIDLARLITRLAGSSTAPVCTATPAGDRPRRLVCDTTAARTSLGFAARRSLDEGLSEEIGWFRSQQRDARRDSLQAHPRHSVASAVA
jgi:nucleoside-diphosphate-sugar epimerase